MKKIGIVFSGGGGKGAYELGVWKALHEWGYDQQITGASGTSIGGLNSVMFTMRDFETLEKIWEEAKVNRRPLPRVMKTRIMHYLDQKLSDHSTEEIYRAFDIWLHQSFLSSKKLQKLIEKHIQLDRLRNSDCDCYIACHDYRKKEAVYYHLNTMGDVQKIKRVLRATASIPFLFSPVRMENRLLVDGGLSDNTPIVPLYLSGFDTILVIRLKEEQIDDQKQFPNARIFTLVPKDNLGKFFNGTLNFYSDVIDLRIQQGYEEMKDFLKSHHDIFEDQVYKKS